MYNIKTTEHPFCGYTLLLRAPTLHQHAAIVGAFKGLDLRPLWDAMSPLVSAAKGEAGDFVSELGTVLPAALAAFRDTVLIGGAEACVNAAAIALDTRANYRRLSIPCPDPDFDTVRLGDYDCGPDGHSYLQCEQLRKFVRAYLTTDEALWVIFEAIRLGGYADMGKALVAQLAGTLGTVASMAPKTPSEPITA